ncbi:hypothetical protein J6590_095347 [Homalodisca vitripennis]|nr:hypothetical protein J6590_095347 [Homalodisca vitripennis]
MCRSRNRSVYQHQTHRHSIPVRFIDRWKCASTTALTSHELRGLQVFIISPKKSENLQST